MNSRPDFFLPVQVLSALFQKKLLFYLKKASKQGKLHVADDFSADISLLYQKKWVVYSKKPFASAEQVLRYLGRYTHRVAISNGRIVDVSNDSVTFSYKDYRDKDKRKIMSVTAIEFLRRFLLHVLPPRFVKIRSYGLLSNANQKRLLPICQALTSKPETKQAEIYQSEAVSHGFNPAICPKCKQNSMRRVEQLLPQLKIYRAARPP